MSIFGDFFSSIDKTANSLNPFKQPMQWATDNTVSKVFKPAGQLYDYSNSHPLESLAAMAAIYYGAGAIGSLGEGGAGAGAGAAAGEGGAAAGGGTAMGGSAGTLGAADSAGASSQLGLTAADVGGTSGATAGGGAGAGSSAWMDYGKTALKTLGPTVLSSVLAPKPPKTKAPMAMPDPLAQQQAIQQKLIAQMARRGRASTILTNPASGGSLGG